MMIKRQRRNPPATVDAHTERAIAVQGGVAPPTVRRYLAGLLVRSTCRARIEGALREMGRADLIREEARATG